MNIIAQIFSYPFAVRALIAGGLISLCAGLLGVNLVLKRFSMLGDGLSHVSFGSAAVALAAGVSPLKISIPIVIIAAFLLLRLNERGKIRGDAATAIVSSSALAIGIIVATLTTGMNTDISNYMFGSILAMSRQDVILSAVTSACVVGLYAVFYNKIFACTFDEDFALATGVNVKLYNSITAVLTALIVVIGMRMMGALLISSIITFPALSSMRVFKKYRSVMMCCAAISVATFLAGMLLSFLYDIPAGASIVVMNLIVFVAMFFIGKIKTAPFRH